MRPSFLKLFVVVSVVSAAALVLLVEGAKRGEAVAIAGGALLAIPAIVGIAALARVVVLSEREGGRR